MTEEQAKEYLTNNYICCCPYGTSPAKCGDEKCEFGQAIRALIKEKPQGEWIAREDMDYIDENKVVHNHFECNKCGLIHDFIDGHTSQYNFCPNCGANMRGDT